jgi:hypothetical protein
MTEGSGLTVRVRLTRTIPGGFGLRGSFFLLPVARCKGVG